jgi:hypothetical protein
MMQEAVGDGHRQGGIADDLALAGEALVGGQHGRAPLVASRDQFVDRGADLGREGTVR